MYQILKVLYDAETIDADALTLAVTEEWITDAQKTLITTYSTTVTGS